MSDSLLPELDPQCLPVRRTCSARLDQSAEGPPKAEQTVDFTVRTKPTVRYRAHCGKHCPSKGGRALLAAPPTHATAVRWSRLRRSMRAALRRAACAAAAARIPPSSPSLHRTAPHCGHRAQWDGCACIGLCACGIECLCATGSENHPQRGEVRSGGGCGRAVLLALVSQLRLAGHPPRMRSTSCRRSGSAIEGMVAIGGSSYLQ
jgi:rRNA maturation protein Nop10